MRMTGSQQLDMRVFHLMFLRIKQLIDLVIDLEGIKPRGLRQKRHRQSSCDIQYFYPPQSSTTLPALYLVFRHWEDGCPSGRSFVGKTLRPYRYKPDERRTNSSLRQYVCVLIMPRPCALTCRRSVISVIKETKHQWQGDLCDYVLIAVSKLYERGNLFLQPWS